MAESIYDFDVPQLRHPFTFIVAGGTMSGKTTFVCKLIKYLDKMIQPIIDDVIIFYKEYQEGYDFMQATDSRVRCIEGINMSAIHAKNTLLVIDDQMTDSLKDKTIQELFTSGVHHK